MERYDCDIEDGNNDVLVLGFQPATINFVASGRLRSQTKSSKTKEVFTAVKSRAFSKSPQALLKSTLTSSKKSLPRNTWASFVKSPSNVSSVAPIAEATAATGTKVKHSLPQKATENATINVKRKTVKKTADEKVVQLRVKGVWVLRHLAANVCEVTFVNRLEDKGDIPVEFVNMGVAR